MMDKAISHRVYFAHLPKDIAVLIQHDVGRNARSRSF